MSTITKPKTTDGSAEHEYRSPHLKTTRYDRAWSFMIAVVAGLVVAVFLLLLIWWSNRPVTGSNELIMVNMNSGGDPDGDDSPLEVISPDPPTDDPAVVDEPADVNEISQVMETVLELSDNAALQVQQQLETGAENVGTPGSREGSNKPPLGSGGKGPGGFGDRWFITFADKDSLSMYRKQLDYFKIEIGYFNIDTRELTYVKNFSRNPPTKRVVKTDKKDKRFFFLWQGGGRKKADEDLLKAAGINVVPRSVIVHFYTPQLVDNLARTERAATRRKLTDVARTYFSVRPEGSGFKFLVTRISYKN